MKDKVIKSSFGDLSFLVIASLGSLVLQFGTVTLSTRILGTEGYGKLALFLMVAQLIFLFGISWTSAAVIRYGREEFTLEGKISKTFWGRNVILLPVVLLFLSGVIIFRKPVLGYIQLPSYGLLLLIFYVLGNLLLNYVQYIQQAIGQLRLFAASKIVQKVVSLSGLSIVLIVPFIEKDIISVIIVAIIAIIITSIGFAFFLKKDLFLPIEIDRDFIKKIFLFSYPVIFGSGSAYIVSYIDIIVIKKYMKIRDIGIYSLSYQGFTALQAISMSLIAVLGPMMVTFLSENREDLIRRFVTRLIKQGVLIWSIFLSIVIFLAYAFIPIVFGKEFRGSILPFSILMVGLGYNCLASFYSPVLTTFELIKQSMTVNVLMALINLAGDFMLVPRLGISGAAIASSFSFSFAAFCYLFISTRKLKVKEWQQVFSALPVLFMSIAAFLTKVVWLQGLSLVIIILVTILIVKKTSVFRKEDIEMFSTVKMPLVVRKALTVTYLLLSREKC